MKPSVGHAGSTRLLLGAATTGWESRPFDGAMGAYQQARDTHTLPMYEYTTQLATLEPPPPEVAQVLGAVAGNPDAMDAFAGVYAATMSPDEFFDPAHVEGIMGRRPDRGAGS